MRHVESVARHEDAERHAFNRRPALSTRCSRRSFLADPSAFPPTMGMTLIAGGLNGLCPDAGMQSGQARRHLSACAQKTHSDAQARPEQHSEGSLLLFVRAVCRALRSRGLPASGQRVTISEARRYGKPVPGPAGRHLGGSVHQAPGTHAFTVRGTQPAR